jgi:hypothetical protein
MHRRIVGHYCVEARTLRTPNGAWKSAYLVEPVHGGPRDFTMITLLDEFDSERAAIDAAMERGARHAQWLDAAHTVRST